MLCMPMTHDIAADGERRSVATRFLRQLASADKVLTTTLMFDTLAADGVVERASCKTLRQRLYTTNGLVGVAAIPGIGIHQEVVESGAVHQKYRAV